MTKDINSNPKFTVIIPTRERCDTLRWSLKTCVEQNYENLEILVSDNFSQDASREVVASYTDQRIRYINTGKRLSMSHNWEFALAHATGDYVTIIGDDDGLMPNGLDYAREVINDTGTDALICKKPLYYWPNVRADDYRNVLVVSTEDTLEKKDSGQVLENVTRFRAMDDLPMIYDGFVKKDVLDRVKAMSGRFFNSQVPDYYSGIALLGALPDYYHSLRPFLIQGISGHSIGASYLVQSATTATAANRFYAEENIPFHPNLIQAPVVDILVAESLLRAKDNVRTPLDFSFDEKVLVDKAMETAVPMTPEKYAEVVAGVEHIGKTYNIRDHAAAAIARNPNSPVESKVFQMGYNFIRKILAVRMDENKVSNIYEAGIECENIRNNLTAADYLKNSMQYIGETARRPGIVGRVGRAFNSFITGKSI